MRSYQTLNYLCPRIFKFNAMLKTNAFHKYFYCLIVCMLVKGNAMGQELQQKVSEYFQLQTLYPQEKIYLHLDKNNYAAGERIYWKGYLIDAITHSPETKSNYIYVELVDRSDKVLVKCKARREKDIFHGSILLIPEIPAGEYYLRAYTQWMMNAGKDFFYYHKLHIGNALDRSIQSSIRYEVPQDGICSTAIQFTNEANQPLPEIQVQVWITADGKRLKRYSRRTNTQGEISFDIPVEEKEGKNRTIEIEFKDESYNYSKTFYVPLLGDKKNEFALSFFPEGGDLLAGYRQRVAFKAQRADGTNCSVHGILMNGAGDTITAFRTVHDGMGVFSFLTSADTQYKVKVSQDSTVYREFDLPAVKTEGKQLMVSHHKGVVNYEVFRASQDSWNEQDTLFLIGHTRGVMTIFLPLTTNRSTGRFNETDLSEGVTELLLVDRSGLVLSRRLILVTSPDLVDLTMDALPSEWSESRKLVEIPVRFTDKQGQPLQTSFSVSLTDKNLVTPDSLTDNIRSSFLLTSELKGYIENPGYYFLKKNASTEYHTELLLLTHGWCRFKHDNIAELPMIYLDYFMEAGQTISGKASTLIGRKAKDVPVVLMAPSEEISVMTNTDEEGNFVFDNIEFCDTVSFVAQGMNKNGFLPVFLKIDSVPSIPPYSPFPPIDEEAYNQPEFLAYENAVRDSYLGEGGMKVIHLNEVTVTASKRAAGPAPLSALSNLVWGDKLTNFGGSTAYDVVTRTPGVWQSGGKITLSGETQPPLFIISQMRYESESAVDALKSLDISTIESIEVIKGASAVFLGHEAAAGAVIVNLKDGAKIEAKAAPGLTMFTMQGYSKAVEFYHPVYETPEQMGNKKTDFRTTVYWNQDLQTDEDGKAIIRFYTPDNQVKPHLVIEGVAPSGYLMRFER